MREGFPVGEQRESNHALEQLKIRTLVANNGVTVGIVNNPGENYITYGIGDVSKMSDLIREPYQRIHEIDEDIRFHEEILHQKIITEIRINDPEASDDYFHYNGGVSTALNNLYWDTRNKVLESNPDLTRKILELREQRQQVLNTTYNFPDMHNARNLYAGDKGVLYCDPHENPRSLADHLEGATDRDSLPPIQGLDVNVLHQRSRSKQAWLTALQEMIEQNERDPNSYEYVAHINQVAVPADERGHGHAAALIDIALFNLSPDIKFITAEVLLENETGGAAMTKTFINAGFDVFYVPRIPTHSGANSAHLLVIKENPHYRNQKSRDRFERK